MIEGSLKLTCGPLSLVIDRFSGNQFPRTRIGGPGLEYSGEGNPVVSGTAYEPKHQWEFTAELDAEDASLLGRIYDYWLLTSPHPTVYIEDYTKPVRGVTQTRALAEGVSATTLTTPSGWKEYYARFAAQFLSEPTLVKDGRYRQVACLLQELDRVAPA